MPLPLPAPACSLHRVGPRVGPQEAELVDCFRAVRVWAPHYLLSQLVLGACRRAASAAADSSGASVPLAKRPRLADDGTAGAEAVGLRASSSVLELNAGTGACGIFASHGLEVLGDGGSSRRVWLAERCAAALPLLQLNVGINRLEERCGV